ncbi:MAG: ABC transporter permease [Candidatus Nanoarchaeia archaeon]|nr:ABC transporter permease [Candidatus Nanoarchaeia archaeon]
MIKDFAMLSISTFKARKMRSLLTMMGIFIGVALLVTLVSLGRGLEDSITQQFESLGTDKIYLYPGVNMFSAAISDQSFSESELNAVGKVKGVKLVAGFVFKVARLEYNDEVKYANVIGIPLDEGRDVFKDMTAMKAAVGRDLQDGDKSKAVVGISLTEPKTMFTKGMRIGDKFLIENSEFSVVGVLGRIGNPEDDSQLMIPLDTAMELFDMKDKYGYTMLQVQEGASPKDVALKVKKELRSIRGLDEGDEDFSVQTTDDMMESFQIILNVVQAILLGLAAISLVVGGIGIMNTMYTAIIERTRQIGVMKAIGATNFHIALIFQIESGLLGLAGGIVGCLIGMGIGKLVEFGAHAAGITFFNVSFPWWLIAGALAFSTVLGIASGVLPSMQAAKMKPIDALRYE